MPDNKDVIEKNGNVGVWWHPDNLGPLKKTPFIKQFGSMRFSKVKMDDTMRPHLNDGIEIHFVNSGKYDWVVEGNKIELLPENLSVTAPWHKNGSLAGKMDIGHINWIVIKPSVFTSDQHLNLGSWTKLPQKLQKSLGEMIADENNIVIKKAKNFKKYFVALKDELCSQQKGYDIMVSNIVENLLIDLHRHLSSQKQKTIEEDTFIDKLTQVILKDIDKKWVIEDLAYRFGMGKTKFTYEVKKLTGYPPNSFIINLKIEKAIDMLQNQKNQTMSQIAYICGFSSLQHFTNTFSQRVGITPGQYKMRYDLQ